MSDKKTVICDEMIDAQLKEKSDILNISVEELIDRYLRRGILEGNSSLTIISNLPNTLWRNYLK